MENIKGRKFGRLKVLDRCFISKMPMWVCLCDCGKSCMRDTSTLKRGNSFSCGCLRHERRCTHGYAVNTKERMPEYNSWSGMKSRCYNENEISYKNYGGRGITVCKRWKESFLNFLEDVGPKPPGDYSIDRINVNGNYEPTNCRWATRHTQVRNKTNSVYYEMGGIRMTVIDWAIHFKVRSGQFCSYVIRHGFGKAYFFYSQEPYEKNGKTFRKLCFSKKYNL